MTNFYLYCLEVVKPILEQESGFIYGQDFRLAYSPERVNPGDEEHTLQTLKQINYFKRYLHGLKSLVHNLGAIFFTLQAISHPDQFLAPAFFLPL